MLIWLSKSVFKKLLFRACILSYPMIALIKLSILHYLPNYPIPYFRTKRYNSFLNYTVLFWRTALFNVLLGPFHGAIAVPCHALSSSSWTSMRRRRATVAAVATPGEWQCKTARSSEWAQHISNASCYASHYTVAYYLFHSILYVFLVLFQQSF